MGKHAVFLDRDGTLNEDPGYLGDPNLVKLFPQTGRALALLKNKGFKLVVISNQSGISRGLITESDVKSVNQQINKLLNKDNVSIDSFYFCPAHPEFSTPEECKCRKPSNQMVMQAADELNLELSLSYFIGDTVADIQCAKNSGVKSILVKTGYGSDSLSILQNQNNIPSFVAENLIDASNFIISDYSGKN